MPRVCLTPVRLYPCTLKVNAIFMLLATFVLWDPHLYEYARIKLHRAGDVSLKISTSEVQIGSGSVVHIFDRYFDGQV